METPQTEKEVIDLDTINSNIRELSYSINCEKKLKKDTPIEGLDSFAQLLDYLITISYLHLKHVNQILNCVKENFEPEIVEKIVMSLLKGLLARRDTVSLEPLQDDISREVRTLMSGASSKDE